MTAEHVSVSDDPGLRVFHWLPPEVTPKAYLERGYKMAVCELIDERRGNPRPLVNTHVRIDGVEYEVRGVETFAVMDGHPALKGPFSLMLKPVDPEDPQ